MLMVIHAAAPCSVTRSRSRRAPQRPHHRNSTTQPLFGTLCRTRTCHHNHPRSHAGLLQQHDGASHHTHVVATHPHSSTHVHAHTKNEETQDSRARCSYYGYAQGSTTSGSKTCPPTLGQNITDDTKAITMEAWQCYTTLQRTRYPCTSGTLPFNHTSL